MALGRALAARSDGSGAASLSLARAAPALRHSLLETARVELPVATALGEQLFVRAALHDPPRLEYADLVCIAHDGEPVRDNEARTTFHDRVHATLHEFLEDGEVNVVSDLEGTELRGGTYIELARLTPTCAMLPEDQPAKRESLTLSELKGRSIASCRLERVPTRLRYDFLMTLARAAPLALEGMHVVTAGELGEHLGRVLEDEAHNILVTDVVHSATTVNNGSNCSVHLVDPLALYTLRCSRKRGCAPPHGECGVGLARNDPPSTQRPAHTLPGTFAALWPATETLPHIMVNLRHQFASSEPTPYIEEPSYETISA